MKIKYLKLLNFRNHYKLDLDFERINLILGPNGSGKTSILEAIVLLSTSRSPRTVNFLELINFQKQKSYLELGIEDQNQEIKTIRLILARQQEKRNKTFSFDGVVVEPKEIIGVFKTVYFSPETLEIINGSPTKRRRFIDILISQTNPSYLNDLIEYKKILINRNKLLKEIALRRHEREEIIFWDEKLIEVGSRIIFLRKNVLSKISNPLQKFHRQIIGGNLKLATHYRPSFALDKGHPDIESAYMERLTVEFDLELRYGNTLYGPHRDDIRFSVDGHDVASFCSRGEIRSIIVALKLAEAYYIEKETGDLPVILLDDIFSELDKKRAAALSGLIHGKYQSIITSSESELINRLPKNKIKIIRLKKARIYV